MGSIWKMGKAESKEEVEEIFCHQCQARLSDPFAGNLSEGDEIYTPMVHTRCMHCQVPLPLHRQDFSCCAICSVKKNSCASCGQSVILPPSTTTKSASSYSQQK